MPKLRQAPMGLHLCFLKTIFCLVIWSDAQSPQVVSICAGAPSSSPQGRNAAARRLAIHRDQQRERDHHDYRLRADSQRADQRQRPRLLQRVPPLPLWQDLADQYNWRLPEERLSRQHFISAVSCTYCRSFSTTLKGKNGQCFSDELIRIEREFQAVGLGHANALVLARRGLFRVLPSNHWHRSRQLLACQRSRKWV